jgi:hypothetical protein
MTKRETIDQQIQKLTGELDDLKKQKQELDKQASDSGKDPVKERLRKNHERAS